MSTCEPAIGIVIIAPMPWGATSRPACSVDSPRTSWKYVGTSSSPPKKAAANRNMVMIESVRLRFLNSRRSSSGCSGRNEWNTKATIRTAPISIGTQTFGAAAVPSPGMEETPYRNSASPGDISAMPRKSNDSDGSGVSFGSTRQA